jgi:uncharacterized protein YecE (DUF72 family)
MPRTPKTTGARLYIGTSGWSYKHWVGPFYPPKLPANQHLPFYLEHFNTVELNASFYRLPFENLITRWRTLAPEGFLYAVKGSKFITHTKRLRNIAEPLKMFYDRMAGLKEHFGPVLFQLPPTLQRDDGLLAEFLAQLDRRRRHTVEFRHESWNNPAVFDILCKFDVAYCILSSPRLSTVVEVTAPFAYVRFHGATQYYRYNYSEQELQDWGKQLRPVMGRVNELFVYFNNDEKAYAAHNAKRLREILLGRSQPPSS